MTTSEKFEKLQIHCIKYDETTCNKCVLHDTKYSTGGICIDKTLSDSDIEYMYRLVFGVETDPVNHPSHYTDGKIEVIDFIEDKKLGFCRGNAIKYISRAGKKDPTKEVEDLKKAKWYIERRIKELKEGIA